MIEVIDDTVVGPVIKKIFQDDMPDAIFILTAYKANQTDKRASLHGLDVALERAATGRPIILYGLESEKHLVQDSRFVAAVGKKNVRYIKEPFCREDVHVLYASIKKENKTEDTLAFEILAIQKLEQAISVLRHELGHVQHDSKKMLVWLSKARELGFKGNKTTVIRAVNDWKRSTKGVFNGKYFPGVFIDVQGTLLNSDGTLNQAILTKARKWAVNRPITIWTDGDLQDLTPCLRALGIEWKIVSKFDFAGAEVEEVIDDFTAKEFLATYNIVARQYTQV